MSFQSRHPRLYKALLALSFCLVGSLVTLLASYAISRSRRPIFALTILSSEIPLTSLGDSLNPLTASDLALLVDIHSTPAADHDKAVHSAERLPINLQLDQLKKIKTLNKQADLTASEHRTLSEIADEISTIIEQNRSQPAAKNEASTVEDSSTATVNSRLEALTKAVSQLDEARHRSNSAEFKPGTLLFNAPIAMRTSQSARVSAVLRAGNYPDPTVNASMRSRPGTLTDKDSLQITPRMKMLLQSGDFDVTLLSSLEQSVGGLNGTQWDWDIVPKRSGTLRLHLASVVLVGSSTRDITTADREIIVNVDTLDEAQKMLKANLYVAWTAGGTMLGLLGGLVGV